MKTAFLILGALPFAAALLQVPTAQAESKVNVEYLSEDLRVNLSGSGQSTESMSEIKLSVRVPSTLPFEFADEDNGHSLQPNAVNLYFPGPGKVSVSSNKSVGTFSVTYLPEHGATKTYNFDRSDLDYSKCIPFEDHNGHQMKICKFSSTYPYLGKNGGYPHLRSAIVFFGEESFCPGLNRGVPRNIYHRPKSALYPADVGGSLPHGIQLQVDATNMDDQGNVNLIDDLSITKDSHGRDAFISVMGRTKTENSYQAPIREITEILDVNNIHSSLQDNCFDDPGSEL